MANQYQFVITKKFIRDSAKSSGFDFLSSLGEIIDNSISANAKLIKIRITQQEDPTLATFVIEDDGCGMDQDKMIKALSELGHEGKYDQKSISYFGSGVKFALFYLCEKGKVSYKSTRDGIETHLWFTTDDTAGFINLEPPTKTLCPNGTKVKITNVIFNLEKDLEEFNRFLSVTYYPTFKNNNKFQIVSHNTINPKEMTPIKFENPLYSHLTENKFGVRYFNRLDEVAKVNDESVNISGYIYNNEAFVEEDFIEWDSTNKIKTQGRPKEHGFNSKRSGVFFKCGSRYATLGNHVFLFWRPQYDTNNLRIEVEVPHSLFSKFLQLNKSKIKLSDLGLSDFKEKITKIYNEHQRNLPSVTLDIEKDLTEQLVNEINGELKGNIDKNPLERTEIQDVIPEAPKPEKKEHQGGSANQPFGKQRKDNFVDVVYEARGKYAPYYDACRINKTLLIKLNNDHPFVQHFIKKNKTEQKSIINEIYAGHIALCDTQATEEFSNDAFHKVIMNKSDILRKLYS